MAVANTLAYYFTANSMAEKSFIVQVKETRKGTVIDNKQLYNSNSTGVTLEQGRGDQGPIQ